MLQRAASNAYSWWWASHIRTKQSKWLDQNLSEMEEKVQITLKLIEEEGDSFAKRAEMYYKNRPELITFVHESFRSYRALAERYDHLSTELQKVNTTLASVFPEQVHFSMDDEEDDASTTLPRQNAPKAPSSGPVKELRTMFSNAIKFQKENAKNSTRSSCSTASKARKSGLSEEDAVLKIDRLQKEILVLQTEKEFLKSSYENGVVKYNAIEKEISGMQDEVFGLKDEFGDGIFIEDEDARSLMSSAALRSCQEALGNLESKQKTGQEAKLEHKRVKAIREKFEALTNKVISSEKQSNLKIKEQKITDHFEAGEGYSLTVTETAEKIDELVNKVISLESAVSSHSALIKRLRIETDGFEAQIQTLEDDKSSSSKDLASKLSEMEDKLHEIQELDQSVQDQNNDLEMHFTEARCTLDRLSEKLSNKKTDKELEITSQGLSLEVEENKPKKSKEESQAERILPQSSMNEESLKQDKQPEESAKELEITGLSQNDNQPANSEDNGVSTVKNREPGSQQKKTLDRNLADNGVGIDAIAAKAHDSVQDKIDESGREEEETEQDGEPNWRLLFMKGMEDREKTLLGEYTTVLRNYKELKKQHVVAEKKSQDDINETTLHLRELKAENARKDGEIISLQQKLKDLPMMFNTIKDGRGDAHSSKSLGEVMSQEDGVKFVFDSHSDDVSPTEEKFRGDIDALLEENLDFWLRFSTSFNQIQKFESEFEDLKSDASKLEKEKKNDVSNARKCALKTDARSIYRHLREIQTELTVWLEQSALLKEELQSRSSSLCNIQEQIAQALKDSAEDEDFKFTNFQAAKFQGELLNMKQENNKVADELQSGLDHVTGIQLQVEQCLSRLNDEFELADNEQLQHSDSRNRIPLSSFIFGVKQKKQKQSIFSVVGPALNKRYIIK